jgi:two-component system phosphate regulon response regulator PhoB
MARILFVNDEVDLAELVRLLLEDDGHEVHVALEGDDVLAITRRERPDLVILDWVLDGRTGEDVLRELRGDPATARIPILLASALVDLRVRGEALGADDTLSKPFTSDDLRQAIARLLTGKASRAS